MYRSFKEFRPAWVAALRSGDYKRGKGRLCKPGAKADSFCCLGVAFDLLVQAGHRCEWQEGSNAPGLEDLPYYASGNGIADRDFISKQVPKWFADWLNTAPYGVRKREALLAEFNDEGDSFKEIASRIELDRF